MLVCTHPQDAEGLTSCCHLMAGYKASAYTCCHVLMRGGTCWHSMLHVFLKASFFWNIFMKILDLYELATLLGLSPETIKKDMRRNPMAVPP